MSRGAIRSRTLRLKNSKGDLTTVLNTLLRFLGCSLTAALCLICLIGHALAQGNTADLQGLITDPSGGTVSGAHVRLENPSVGLVRETTSRETGEYSFLSLPPARYAVRVEAKGFRAAVISDLVLTVGQKAQLPVRLEISPLAEALNILVSNAEVETTRSSLATTIDHVSIGSASAGRLEVLSMPVQGTSIKAVFDNWDHATYARFLSAHCQMPLDSVLFPRDKVITLLYNERGQLNYMDIQTLGHCDQA
jgi:Carboxypeptidase regulatory-like domain